MSRASENIYWKIIRLGCPILIGQLGMIIVGFADTKMVGLYSTDALASASFVNNIFNMAILCCMGFTYGLTPLIGALFSQRRYADIGSMLRTGLIVNVGFSLLVMAIMTGLYFNLDNLDQPEHLLPLIRPYYLIYLAGVPLVTIFSALSQWLYAINRTRLPMWIALSANVLNIVGNYALIYGNFGFPELGLVGAGCATLAARLLCAIVIVAVFVFNSDFAAYREGFAASRYNHRQSMQIGRTSLPIALQMSFETGSFTIAAVMVGWIGAVPLAAYQIIITLGCLGFCVYYSMAAAVSVLVANAAGQSDRREMRRVAFSGYRIILVLATMSSLLFVFAGMPICRQFTDDGPVLATCASLIFPLVLYQLGDATQINFANALRGTANVMPMLWIAFVSYMVVGVPATYVAAFTCGLGIYGVVLSFSVSLFLAGGLFLYYFLRTTRTTG